MTTQRAPALSSSSALLREPRVLIVDISESHSPIVGASFAVLPTIGDIAKKKQEQIGTPVLGTTLNDYLSLYYAHELCAQVLHEALLEKAVSIEVEHTHRLNKNAANVIKLTPLHQEGSVQQLLLTEVFPDALAQSNQLLRQAELFLESAPDATFIFDPKGHLVLTNREAEHMFGYSRAELMNLSIEELMPERYRHDHLTHRKRFTENPTVREMGAGMMITALTRSGAEIPVDIRLSPIESNDQRFFSASVRNVQTRVDAEQQLKVARDAAERATAEKSRFLAAASHDLRQPLQAIGLYLSVLERTQDPETLQEVRDKMRRSLDNVSDMLEALLDVSRLDSGSVTPRRTRVNLQRLLDEITSDYRQQAHDKQLRFTCDKTNTVLYSDAGLLKRVVENFISNAIRYTDRGEIAIKVIESDTTALIEVHDSGIGIEDSELGLVFEEYYTLGNPMRNRTKGLGLGLAIVKHIAKLMGHSVSVDSVVGEGSVFRIEVPLDIRDHSVNDTSESQHCEEDSFCSVLQILLVDDDDDVRDATHLLLSNAGMEVCSARTAEAALELIAAGFAPDAIISDYRLPGQSGLDLIREVRDTRADTIYALIATGDTSAAELRTLNLDNCDVVYKPIDAGQLLERLQRGVTTKKGSS